MGRELHPLGGPIREWSAQVAGVEWNLHFLDLLGTNGDDTHSEVILIWELSTGKDAELLGPVRTDNTIASENAVDSNSVVKVVSGLGGGEVVDIVIRAFALDFHNFRTSKAFPVEAKLVVITGELVAEQANKLNRVRSNIDIELPILGETDDGGGQYVLESDIAGGEPPYAVYQKCLGGNRGDYGRV